MIERGGKGNITRNIIALVTSRGQVADMLHSDDVIDVVIPREGNDLASYIKANTRIFLLDHADGDACQAVVDSKIDYPSACNAIETLLLHAYTLSNRVVLLILMYLRSAGVKYLGGHIAMKFGLCDVTDKYPKR